MDAIRKILGMGPDTRTKEQKELDERYMAKLKEYEEHFPGDGITTEYVVDTIMTKEEFIANVDKCIKHNRKWEGFIVPELDYEDVDI